jgi:hypothetical protein
MDELIGKTFGKLLVIEEGLRSNQGVRRWKCQCSCGNTVLAQKYNLIHGISKSCGCWNREHNLTGKKFGRLLVLEKMAQRKNHRIYWKCQCDCGRKIDVKGNNLVSGNTYSCGCLKKEQDPINIFGRKTFYSEIEKPEINKKNIFKRYKKGAYARGLVFSLPFEIFSSFLIRPCHYCGAAPDPFNGVDRIDNTKGYLIENCAPCCTTCNNAKKDLPINQFIEWALKASHYIENNFPV